MRQIKILATAYRGFKHVCAGIFTILALSGGSLASAAILDQDSFVSPSDELYSPRIYFSYGQTMSFGQTFVAGISGQINRVDLQLMGYATPTDINVSLLDGSPLSATYTLIGLGHIAQSSIPDIYYGPPLQAYVDFSAQSISVVTGHTYSLLLETAPPVGYPYPFGYVGWGYGLSVGSTAFTGSALTKVNNGQWAQYSAPQTANGFGFRTYVSPEVASVPEPVVWSMMLTGFCLSGVSIRRDRAVRQQFGPGVTGRRSTLCDR